jgi:asparagine synthase (glutamine-hydrolysing)
MEGGVARADVAALAPSLEQSLARWFRDVEDRDFLSQMTLVDIATYLPGDILTKVDRASMAHSLEARVPLLDHPLVEFAASLPSRLKIVDGVGKWVMREAVRDLLPPIVLQRPKQGFAVPLAVWFRGPLRHRMDALVAPGARIREYVDDEALQRIVREHRAGRRDHSAQIWRLLALEIWLEALACGNLARPAGALRAQALAADPVAAT